MATLPLAVAIADTVLEASARNTPVEVEAQAGKLLDEHPEADVTHEQVVETLTAESVSAGLGVEPGRGD